MIIPPFAGVRLVEYRERIEMVAVYRYREIVGLGRCKADKVGPQVGDPMFPLFNAIMGDREIWVIVHWRRYEDGQEEAVNSQHLDPEATEEEARKSFETMIEFLGLGKKELEGVAKCFKAQYDELAYVENRFPDWPDPPDKKLIDESDLYKARLKVLGGMLPRTATLMEEAYRTEDPGKREEIERQVVQSYFVELAHYWKEDEVLAWLRGNPLGTESILEFARVRQRAKLELDRVNYELVLNWLRRKYNLLTAKELSDTIFETTGERFSPEAIQKRRERLGLTTKREPGPPPRESQ